MASGNWEPVGPTCFFAGSLKDKLVVQEGDKVTGVAVHCVVGTAAGCHMDRAICPSQMLFALSVLADPTLPRSSGLSMAERQYGRASPQMGFYGPGARLGPDPGA